MTVGGGAPSVVALYTWDLGLQRATAGTGLIGTTATTTAITIGRVGILTTFPGDVRVEGVTTLVGGETFEGLVTVTSSTGAGAAGVLGPEEILIQNTQAADAGNPIRNPGYLDWEGRFWTGAASAAAKFGRFGAVVDTQAAGTPSTYRMVWTNAAGTIQWGVSEAGVTRALGGCEVYASLADANPQARLSAAAIAFGAGGASALDLSLTRQAAGIGELGSGHSLYAVGAGRLGARAASADAQPTADLGGGALRLGPGGAGVPDTRISRSGAGVLQLDNGGAGAATLLGPSDGLNVLGTAASRWASAAVNQYDVFAAASAANPTVRITTNSLAMGAGGASALDVVLSRGAADRWEGGSGDTIATVGAGIFSNRSASGDANARMALDATSLSFGAGGASVLDLSVNRQAAGVAELGSGQSLFGVGATNIGRRNASADANPTLAITASGLVFGAGGVSATDVVLQRQAIDVLELGSGDSAFAVGAGVLGVRTAGGDANPRYSLSTSGFRAGAGGAGALDATIARQAAGVWETGSGHSLYAVAASLGLRGASGDANPTAVLTGATLFFGAGGGSATDVSIARGAANRLDLTAQQLLFSPTGRSPAAATESLGVDWGTSVTSTWAAGAGPLATQREHLFRAPTYAGNAGGALTITDAATVAIAGPPVAGANMTLTNPWALWIQAGALGVGGGITSGRAGAAAHSFTATTFAMSASTSWAATGAAATTYTLGDTNTTGLITLGRSTVSNTISIGAGNQAAANVQTINIGTGAGAGTTALSMGNGAGTSTAVMQSGGGTINSAGAAGASYWQINTGGTLRLGSGSVDAIDHATTIGSITGASGFTASAGTGTVSMFTSAAARTINFGTGAAAQVLTLGSTTGASSLGLQAGTAGATVTSPTVALTQSVATSGSPTLLGLTGAAHTTLAAGVEASDVNLNLGRTVQFATGAIANQRACRIQSPTYGFVAASTITSTSTLHIDGPPKAGTNATFGSSIACLWLNDSNTYVLGPSSANMSYATLNVASGNTYSISGGVNVTGAFSAFSNISLGTYSITSASVTTVTNAANLYIAGAPTAAGSVTITNAYSIWAAGGLARLDGGVTFAGSGQSTLNNYTEGTFSPTVTLVGGAGNTVPNYTTNTGRYTRIGRQVFVEVYLTGDGGTAGAGTGQINIALPITASASNPTSFFWAGYLKNGATEDEVVGQIVGSGTTVALTFFNAISTTLGLTGADQNNATRTIRLKFFYEV